MITPLLLRTCRLLLAAALPLSWLPAGAAAAAETNRRLPDIENQFDRLRSHADFLGFRHDPDIAPVAWGEPDKTSTHYQGIARSTSKGWGYLFVTRAGVEDDDRASLMVVRMGSRNIVGERFRSNRYEKSDSVEGTQPPASDAVIKSFLFSKYHHPGGIQLCGDILAVPLEDVIGDGPVGKVVFFDVSEPEDPKVLPVTVTSSSKIGIAGLTKLPDGRFLLVTTGGSGETLKFYRSNKNSFFEHGFDFVLHDTFDVDDVTGGTWTTGSTSHQALQLMVNRDENGVESVYLIAGRNDKITTPFISGKDLLYLYKVSGWESGSSGIRIREIKQRQMHTDSGNSANGELSLVLRDSSSFHTDANGNFLAGLCTYVSPTGELLVYAIEHFNWGPRGSVRFCEFRHEQVYREQNPIYEKQPVLEAPEFITEDSSALLDAGDSKRLGSARPWVEIFEDANYNGRSVIMDWADRSLEDFKDLRKLSWPDGFNDKASSVRWFAPHGWKIRLYDGDNYKVNDEEPYLDLDGLGYQGGIRVLSESPYKFDNTTYDGVLHETRVTSMKFIPPGYYDDFDVFTNPFTSEDPGTESSDDGWSNPKQHLTYRWRLLDERMQPVSSAYATLTPIAGSPWLAKLQTFRRGVEKLNAELTLGPFPEQKIVRTIRFVKSNRIPVVQSSVRSAVGGLITLEVIVKDDDTSDLIDLALTWGSDPKVQRIRGSSGQRSFTVSHEFTNPDPGMILKSDFLITVQATDSAEATSDIVEQRVQVRWRANFPPAVGTDTFERAVTSGFKTRIRNLLTNDSEPEGDFFAFAGIRGVYPDGASVIEQDGWLLYSPAPGAGHLPGSFDYALRDQFGAIGSGRVNITPQSSPTGPSLNLVRIQPRDGGGVIATFQGIPNQSYDVFAAPSPGGPWTRLGRTTADSTGRFQIEDANAGNTRFYRTQILAF
jgi:hypothetical protein